MAPLTLTAGPGKRAGREPLFDVHPQTGATIEVFYADRTLVRQVRRWLVLLVSSARLCAYRSGDWSLFDALRRISACGEGQVLSIVIRHRRFGTLVEPF
jgi:hypothetical protein